jgi:hypothetical protein
MCAGAEPPACLGRGGAQPPAAALATEVEAEDHRPRQRNSVSLPTLRLSSMQARMRRRLRRTSSLSSSSCKLSEEVRGRRKDTQLTPAQEYGWGADRRRQLVPAAACFPQNRAGAQQRGSAAARAASVQGCAAAGLESVLGVLGGPTCARDVRPEAAWKLAEGVGSRGKSGARKKARRPHLSKQLRLAAPLQVPFLGAQALLQQAQHSRNQAVGGGRVAWPAGRRGRQAAASCRNAAPP